MPELALYKNNQQPRRLAKGNTGLWYNKFCNQWQKNQWSLKSYSIGTGSGKRTINPKQDWINTVVNGQKVGEEELLQEAVQRRQDLITRMEGSLVILETATPLVTGLGNPHPVENGFTWHHLFGTPFLPASSIKGLVLDWAENWADGEDLDIPEIFGKPGSTGNIVFLDAIPTCSVKLKTEIMTPHYGDYYKSQSPSLVVPGDWLSPLPIPFLAVATRQTFQFAVMSRVKHSRSENLVKKTVAWLEEALATIGAGGKTSTGYGIFQKVLSEEEKWRNELADVNEATLAARFSRNWGKTRKHLGAKIDNYLKVVLETKGDFVRSWENSDKTNERKAYKKIFPS